MGASAPYGSWPSPLTTAAVVRGAATITEVVVDGEDLWWSEIRPDEGGRTTVLRQAPGEAAREMIPPQARVRSLVHEYGGGAWWVRDGVLVYSDGDDLQLRRLDATGLRVLTLDERTRYADGRLTADLAWFVCVRETHPPDGGEPVNDLVAVATNGSGHVARLAGGADFVAAPRPSPDGAHLAWIQWNHPDMPWDRTELWVAHLGAGTLEAPRRLAEGGEESLLQPGWSPSGQLHVLSDRNGWWNLYRVEWASGELVPVRVGDFEIGGPPWVLGQSSYAFTASGQVVCDVDIEPLSDPQCVRTRHEEVIVSGASWDSESQILRIGPGGDVTPVRPPRDLGLDPAWFPAPEAVTFPTGDGAHAHAWFYAPANPEWRGPPAQAPPLIVLVHGGPTGNARRSLHLPTRFWTSRGVAVLEVDYRGSTGYGRRFRRLLEGRWGEVDVEDCIAGAGYLVARGDVDADRLVIRGSSAGGLTVLAALASSTVFAAGTLLYGVVDLEALARDTHKFESRYLDRLIGPYPDERDRWRARSPIRHVDQIRTPLLVMQGLEDTIVPPSQAEVLIEALAANGVAHAYLPFAGEGHGFRRAETIVAALEAELSFYGQILGFEPADPVEPVAVVGR